MPVATPDYVDVCGYESSGRFDRPLPLWEASADRVQRLGLKQGAKFRPFTFGIHTEAYFDKIMAAFSDQPGNWRAVRLKGTDAEEIVATWDDDVWELLDARAVQCDRVAVFTKAGRRRPQTTMLEVLLRDRATGALLVLEGMHWPLNNTKRRLIARAQCRLAAQAHWRGLKKANRLAQILHLADTNLDVRNKREFAYVRSIVRPVGMWQTWNFRALPKRGTMGRRLIDNGFTNMDVRVYGTVLPDDAASDHGPWGAIWRMRVRGNTGGPSARLRRVASVPGAQADALPATRQSFDVADVDGLEIETVSLAS